VLHVKRQAFLRAIAPHEMRGHPSYAFVVAAREVAAARRFDFDNARAEISELACAERCGDRMLERDHRDAIERSHRLLLQNDRGSPSRCSATYEKMRFVEIGATW